jgi:4-amino-4-deoxy-L-arabinose transferase-like glycosyltransferase
MTLTDLPAATARVPMDRLRKTAMLAGGLYLVTFAASIPARFFFLDPVLSDSGYIVGSGADTRVLVGGLLDMVNALACIATAVVLFTVVQRQSQTLALGFVASRLLEAAIISIGVVSLFAVVTLRQDLAGTAGADEASLVPVGAALVAVYEWTFLFGPNVMAAVNALLLGTLMYRSGLVPRAIPLMGLIGAPLLLASVLGVVFGTHDLAAGQHVIAAAPIALWELSLGVYLVVKGFKSSPITARAVPPTPRNLEMSPARR